MSFFHFLYIRRSFLATVVIILLFVALMMVLNVDFSYNIGDILYTLSGITVMAVVSIIIEYSRYRTHIRSLQTVLKCDPDELLAALPQAHNEEQKLYTELIKKVFRDRDAQVQKLQEEQEGYRDFILSWIHEVKLPITAGYMLMRNSTGKTVEELVDKLEDEWRKIDHYVEQVLYYSRIDSFSKDYHISEVSLNRIAKESIKKYSKLFIQKRIRISLWEEEQTVYSDSKWLSYIIDQLVTNALKYTDKGGAISFVYEEDHKEKRLFIRDSGIGIKQEDIGRVFEKGFTGTNGRTANAKSTGMGLYLAEQMARKLGAKLSVRSKEGEYAEFAIHFSKGDGYFDLDKKITSKKI